MPYKKLLILSVTFLLFQTTVLNAKTVKVDINGLKVKGLLQLQVNITNELMDRGIVRTQNNPIGDYTEWLVSEALDLRLATNSNAGYDAIGNDGVKIQIKARCVTPKNQSLQLSAIRNYEEVKCNPQL